MKKRIILTVLLSFNLFGYTDCQRQDCLKQTKHMDGDINFCNSNEGIGHAKTIYSEFLNKKALDKQKKLGIVVEATNIKNDKLQPIPTIKNKTGDIKCYLQDREMYHSDEWIGVVEYSNNMFTYYSKFKNERITVSGPCVVREERE